MARKSPPPTPPALAELLIPREEADQRIAQQVVEGEALLRREIHNEVDYEELRRAYLTWSAYNAELLSRIFTTTQFQEDYTKFLGMLVGAYSTFPQLIKSLQDSIADAVHRLQSIKGRLSLVPVSASVAPAQPRRSNASSGGRRVFVVHGHDDGLRETVARFLDQLGLVPIILHEQPSEGRALLAKMEAHADVGFAVVLLTPDDVGAKKPTERREPELKPRARQNVVLELGFFLGRLGSGNVCAILKGDLEPPSDYDGVVYVPFDGGGWKLQLAREIKAAGIDVDMNKAV